MTHNEMTSLTVVLAIGSAPSPTSHWAISIWPLYAAICRGVNPFYDTERRAQPQQADRERERESDIGIKTTDNHERINRDNINIYIRIIDR